MWLLYWNSAKGSSPSQSSCLWLIKTRRYCSNSWLTRSVDRLVQPLPYETLIFSHFTHFTLRPNSDLTPIRLRVHHSNSDITPTVPRHSPSHAAFHRRSPSITEYHRTITEITKII